MYRIIFISLFSILELNDHILFGDAVWNDNTLSLHDHSMVIHIPANVKHWHGAAADSWFAHLAFEIEGEKTSNEWLEPVTDKEYDKLK